MPRARLPRFLVSVLLAILAASCQAPEGPIRYEDLVVSGRLAAESGAEAAREHVCGDETRFATALASGNEIELSVSLGESSRLEVAACRPSDPAGAPRDTGATNREPAELHLVVRGTDGNEGGLRLEVADERWSEGALDLSALAGASATLRLRVTSPAGRDLLVSDLWVRHRVAEERDRAVSRSPEPTRILLISVDTLRGDFLAEAPYSEERPAPDVPGLANFAEEAQIFTPHYAAASWTKPSHGSLLTGVPVETHGALLREQPLSTGVATLAERLSGGGFRTAGLVTDTVWLDPKFGFDRGFDEYRLVRWNADQSVRHAVSWITAHRQEPFFFFLHLFTPHSDKEVLPYEATGVSRETVAERFHVEDYGCRRGACASGLLLSLNAGRVDLIPGEEEILRSLYARGVETVDRALARLFADLEEMGLLDRILVIVTSDHGEAFFEHGQLLHSTVHEEIIQVPLLVRWPGSERTGEVKSIPTSSIDIAPTVLRAAGLPFSDLPGRALQGLAGRGTERREIFAGTMHKAIIAHPWKAIFSLSGDSTELYRLDRDPTESHDLSAEYPDILRRLKERVTAHVKTAKARSESTEPTDSPALTPEERRRLEALGYVD